MVNCLTDPKLLALPRKKVLTSWPKQAPTVDGFDAGLGHDERRHGCLRRVRFGLGQGGADRSFGWCFFMFFDALVANMKQTTLIKHR